MVAIQIPDNSKVNSLSPSQLNNLFTTNSNSSNDILLWISAIALILALGSLFYLKKVPKDYQIYQYILIIALAVSTLVLFLNKSKFGNTIKKHNFGNVVNTQQGWLGRGNWVFYVDTTIGDIKNPEGMTGYTGPIKWIFNCSSKSVNVLNPTADTSTLTLQPRNILAVADLILPKVVNNENEMFSTVIIDNEYLTGVILNTDKDSRGVPIESYVCYTGAESPFGEIFLKFMMSNSDGNITLSPNIATCKDVSNSKTVIFKKSGSDCINIDGMKDFNFFTNPTLMKLLGDIKVRLINYTPYDYITSWKVQQYNQMTSPTTPRPNLNDPQRVKNNINGGTGEVFTKLFSNIVVPALGGEYLIPVNHNEYFYSENGDWEFYKSTDDTNTLGKVKFFNILDGGIIISDITGNVCTTLNIIGMKDVRK